MLNNFYWCFSLESKVSKHRHHSFCFDILAKEQKKNSKLENCEFNYYNTYDIKKNERENAKALFRLLYHRTISCII